MDHTVGHRPGTIRSMSLLRRLGLRGYQEWAARYRLQAAPDAKAAVTAARELHLAAAVQRPL